MTSGKANINMDMEADLVIIGGGTSGLAAAVAAAEQGCPRVVVVEKLGVLGGNAAVGPAAYGGIFAVESPLQRRTENVVATRETLLKTALRWAHWDIDPRIVRVFIEKSGDTVRWLESKGVTFSLAPVYPNQAPLLLHVPKDGSGNFPKGSAAMMNALAGDCEKLGVRILTRTKVLKLLKGIDNKISGILAENRKGTFTITTSGVIIATGGFGRNKRLLKKYFSNYHETMKYIGVPNTGEGIRLAAEVGGQIERAATMLIGPVSTARAATLNLGEDGDDPVQLSLSTLAHEPYVLRINKKGRRYIGYDEVAPPDIFIGNAYAMARQPDGIGYVIFDDSMRKRMEEQGTLINRRPNTAAQRTRLPGLERELRKHADRGILKIADSWQEIAAWTGVDPEALANTINEYNSNCDEGYDPVFAQDRRYLVPLRIPPYYAIECHGYFLDTLGGILINEHMQVLDAQYDPIPGLYAAGATTGGWEGKIYCYIVSGEARGFALNSGRIAGENAAVYLVGR